MTDLYVRLGILFSGSFLFFCSLRTIPLSILWSTVLACFFAGVVIYFDTEFLLDELRKLEWKNKKLENGEQGEDAKQGRAE